MHIPNIYHIAQMEDEIRSVKSFFASYDVPLSDDWLLSCTQWIKEENLGARYTLKELQTQIYNQWLLLDLRDVDLATLPPNLNSRKHFVFNGNFCLQMLKVVDISKPKLWQLQKIRNSNALTRGTQNDSEIAGTGNRMLQLSLTDGVQEVEAMEFRPVQSLSLNMSPGIKIKLMGPLTVRRGRIMLEDHHVKVMGGEVEDLTVLHSAENVLAAALKLPLNPTPTTVDEKCLIINIEDNQIPVSRLPEIENKNLQNCVINANVASSITEEDEMMIAEQVDLLLETEQSCSYSNSKQANTAASECIRQTPKAYNLSAPNNPRTPDMFEDIDLDHQDFERIEQINSSSQKQEKNVIVLDQSLDEDNVFDNIDIDAHLDTIDKNYCTNLPKIENTINSETQIPKCSAPNVHVYKLDKLLQVKSNVTKGIFKVKAKFKGVVEKLTVIDGEYKLVIKIEDDSCEATVRIDSDVISDFAGYCPDVLISMKNDILENNQDATRKVLKAIQNIKNKLIELDDILFVQISKHEDLPIIVKVHL